jgi:DNA invertase Pin-like site-specific DNA recombinase
MITVVGYIRVSTEDQADNGNSLEAQQEAIMRYCAQRGWSCTGILRDVASGKDTRKRPQLHAAIALCDNGEASGIVVAKLDRLTRSVRDFVDIKECSARGGWSLHVIDLGLDLNTPIGEACMQILAVFAQLERHMIVDRIKTGLTIAKRNGKKCGRTSKLDPELVANIVRQHQSGNSYKGIARRLNDAGVPTGQGGKSWHATTIRKIILTQREKTLAA